MDERLAGMKDFICSAWRALDPDKAPSRSSARTACIVRLALVTMQSHVDVARMKTSHVDFETGSWRFPSSASSLHAVPLTPLALSLIRRGCSLRRDPDSEWVFEDIGGTPKRASSVQSEFQKIAAEQSWDFDHVDMLRISGRAMIASGLVEISQASLNNITGRLKLSDVNAAGCARMDDKRRTLAVWESCLAKIIGAGTLR